MKSIKLSPATKENLEFVAQCAHAAYGIYVDRIGREPAPMVADFKAALDANQLQVILSDETLVGYVVSFPRGDHLFVENIALLPAHQGRGYAGLVFAKLEDHCRRTKLSAIELYTNEKMTENLPLYARLGFEITDRRLEDGFKRIYFRKQI